MNAISSKLSRNLDNNQESNEKVKWMLGAPVSNSPQAVNTLSPSLPNNVTEDSESSMDSANATEARRLQSSKYSKL